jgi:zinc/manganese transport system substrate-binding protein
VLDQGQGADYRQRAESFAVEIKQRTPQWRQRVAGKAGALTYHKDAIYLLDFLGLPFLGTLEPVPGVSPTASHLEALAARLKGGKGVIIHTPYQPAAGANKLGQWTGMRVAMLPIEPPAGAEAKAYFDLIDRWVDVLAK